MKENVLEVKTVKIDDRFSGLTITKQDDTVIERGKFKFTASNGVEISSCSVPLHGYSDDNSFLCIGGLQRKEDYSCLIIPDKELTLIIEAIKELNEKYGKVKRWRAEKFECYYYISANGIVHSMADNRGSVYVNNTYELGNYFKTKEQAEECKKRIKKVIDDYHKEIGE